LLHPFLVSGHAQERGVGVVPHRISFPPARILSVDSIATRCGSAGADAIPAEARIQPIQAGRQRKELTMTLLAILGIVLIVVIIVVLI
jgi:hypothetical protein